MIRQLAHVCLGTPDLDRAVDFYQRVLGFETVHEFVNDKGERYGIFLFCGGRTFLELFNDQDTPKDGGLFRHICFEVDDIEEHFANLRKRGLKSDIVRGKTDQTLQSWVFDPDGNKIEFQQYDSHSALIEFCQRRKSF